MPRLIGQVYDSYIEFKNTQDCSMNNGQTVLLFGIKPDPGSSIIKPANGLSFVTATPSYLHLLDMPVVSRRLDCTRSGETGYGVVRVNMTLTGTLTGGSHSEIVYQYQILEGLVGRNDIVMTYKAGQNSIIENKRVYIDSVDEPSGWKQFSGAYQISIHYFVNKCDTVNSFGISAVYTKIKAVDMSDILPPMSYYSPEQGYTFDPVPLWQSNTTPIKGEPTARETSPSGAELGNELEITLTGYLKAESHDELYQKMENLKSGTNGSGVLNYGLWTLYCYKSSGPMFGEVLPHAYVTYTIKVVSYDTEIQLLECSRSFTREHKHTKVTDRLYCKKVDVEQFVQTEQGQYYDRPFSGQYVDYSMRIRGKDRTHTRKLLKRELLPFIVKTGGYEMPGGSEKWLRDQSIQFDAQYYYPVPILNNVDESDEINLTVLTSY